MKTVKRLGVKFLAIFILNAFAGNIYAQNSGKSSNHEQVKKKISSGTEKMEQLVSNWFETLKETKQETGASEENFNLFTNFHRGYIDSERCALFSLIQSGIINDSNITPYISHKKLKLKALYSDFLRIQAEFPTSVEQFKKSVRMPTAADTCFPSCTNIDFSTGDFTGWSGYYGYNNSVTNYNITSITGGLLGAVTKGMMDPYTNNTYQAHITSKSNNDWFLSHYHGINMSQASPFGGNFSAMIGDSTNNGSGVAILSQKFFVSPGATNLSYAYSVFLENPNHHYFEQPFFSVTVLDQNGDTIPNCGQYVVVSKTNIPGFKGEYYPVMGDTIYWKNWTNVCVPLARYAGQCVTIIFEVSDCELGGHCGYAYIAANCSPLAITASSPIICGQSSITLSGPSGLSNYSWTGPANSIIGSDTSSNITVDSAGTYTLVITPVTGGQCKDTLTITIPKNPPLKITSTSANIPCSGNNTGSITAIVSGGKSPYTYSWSPLSGSNATITGLSAGKYTVFVSDSFGCSVSDTITLTQPAVLTAIASGNNETCYGGNNGSKSVTVSGGTPPYKYLWAGCGCTEATVYGVTAGYYAVLVTDSNGCTATAATTITQPAQLIVNTIQLTAILCNGGNNGSVNAVATGGTSPYRYLWTPGGQTTAIASGLTASTYSVLVSDGNGCSSSALITLTQPSALNATTSNTNGNCNGGNNGSASVSATGGTSPYTYLWNPSGQSTAVATGLSSGSYTITITDGNGCTTTAVSIINQPALLNVSVISTHNGCDGSATVMATGGTSPYTYLWSPSNQTTATATGLNPGNYTITVSDANGCSATSSTSIIQLVPLNLSVTSSQQSICYGQKVKIEVAVSGGVAPYTYLWNTGNTTSAFTAAPTVTTSYSINITDSNGCSTMGTITIAVGTPITAFSSGNNSACPGMPITLGVNPSGGDGNYHFNWMPGNSTTPSITITPSGTTTYTLIITDGCSKADTIIDTAIVNPLPVVNFTAGNTHGCAPLCNQFGTVNTISSGSVVQWDWNFGDGAIYKGESPTHCYDNSGQYDVTLTVVSNAGCSATLQKTAFITVYGAPHAAFTANPQPANILNPTVQFTDQSSDKDGIAAWNWNFGEPGDSNTSSLTNPFHTYKDTGNYQAELIVTNVHGCVDSVSENVTISPIFTLYFPNAFTPNGDGLNDVFMPKGDYVKDFEMLIYDRWGMKLFETNSIDKGWNGTTNGNNTVCQEDTYVYSATATDARGNIHNYSGQINLIK